MLFIQKVTIPDDGKYICNVSNGLVERSADIDIKVQCKFITVFSYTLKECLNEDSVPVEKANNWPSTSIYNEKQVVPVGLGLRRNPLLPYKYSSGHIFCLTRYPVKVLSLCRLCQEYFTGVRENAHLWSVWSVIFYKACDQTYGHHNMYSTYKYPPHYYYTPETI